MPEMANDWKTNVYLIILDHHRCIFSRLTIMFSCIHRPTSIPINKLISRYWIKRIGYNYIGKARSSPLTSNSTQNVVNVECLHTNLSFLKSNAVPFHFNIFYNN